jgi:hypothetical protein
MLTGVIFAAFSTRLFSVLRFESVIHEVRFIVEGDRSNKICDSLFRFCSMTLTSTTELLSTSSARDCTTSLTGLTFLVRICILT